MAVGCAAPDVVLDGEPELWELDGVADFEERGDCAVDRWQCAGDGDGGFVAGEPAQACYGSGEVAGVVDAVLEPVGSFDEAEAEGVGRDERAVGVGIDDEAAGVALGDVAPEGGEGSASGGDGGCGYDGCSEGCGGDGGDGEAPDLGGHGVHVHRDELLEAVAEAEVGEGDAEGLVDVVEGDGGFANRCAGAGLEVGRVDLRGGGVGDEGHADGVFWAS